MTVIQTDCFGFSEHDLQKAFVRCWLHNAPRYDFIAPNVQMTHNEMDLIAIRKSGFVDEIEIKLSRADFRADFNKTCQYRWKKHDTMSKGKCLANYFYFYVPASIEASIINLMPDHAGLMVFEHGFATERIRAPRLHRERKLTDRRRISLGQKVMYRYWRLVK